MNDKLAHIRVVDDRKINGGYHKSFRLFFRKIIRKFKAQQERLHAKLAELAENQAVPGKFLVLAFRKFSCKDKSGQSSRKFSSFVSEIFSLKQMGGGGVSQAFLWVPLSSRVSGEDITYMKA